MSIPPSSLKRIAVISPFAGDIPGNMRLARTLCFDVMIRGHAPFAPHLLYPQILDSLKSESFVARELGLAADASWLRVAEEAWVYQHRGISDGMAREIAVAEALRIPVLQPWTEMQPKIEIDWMMAEVPNK